MEKIRFEFKRLYLRAIIGIVILLFFSEAHAAEIEGIKFSETVSVQDTQLVLKGLGLLRYKIIFKGYVGGLYLPADVAQDNVLNDVPKRLDLHYFWDISAEKFGEAAAPYLEENVNPKTLAEIKERLEEINGLYQDVRKGDRYTLTYFPEKGTELALNGKGLGIIKGADFAKAYFSIWLGQYPLNPRFKQQLLGK